MDHCERRCADEARNLLEQLDNLLILLSSLRQDQHCVRAYEFRLTLYGAKAYLTDLAASSEDPPPRTFAPTSTALAALATSWFAECREVIERHRKRERRKAYANIAFLLPQLAIIRTVGRAWCMLIGKPYLDPVASNFASIFCTSLATALDDNWETALTESGVDRNEILRIVNQYRTVPQSDCITTFESIRLHVDPTLWNNVLITAIMTDIDRQYLNVLTVDAARAKAMDILLTLASEEDGDSEAIEQAVLSLWNLLQLASNSAA